MFFHKKKKKKKRKKYKQLNQYLQIYSEWIPVVITYHENYFFNKPRFYLFLRDCILADPCQTGNIPLLGSSLANVEKSKSSCLCLRRNGRLFSRGIIIISIYLSIYLSVACGPRMLWMRRIPQIPKYQEYFPPCNI